MTEYLLEELVGGGARLPALPGVYVFRGAEQQVLYVGKSKNLRARVGSYFRQGAAVARKSWALQRFTRTVHIERTGSDFAALLREIELVQALDPPYNRRLRHPERYAYIGIDYQDPFPRLTLTTTPWNGGRFLGPFPPSVSLADTIAVIADAFRLRTCEGEIVPVSTGPACWRRQVRSCSAPCVGATTAGAYGRDFVQAVRALSGHSRAVVSALTDERDQLARLERFEEAARRQRWIEAIERLRRLLFISQRVWHDALVVQPGVTPGTVQMWGVVGGGVRRQAVSPRRQLRQSFAETWQAVTQAPRDPIEAVPQRELDARWIVHRWLCTEAGRRWSVPVRQQSWESVWPRVERLVSAIDVEACNLLPAASRAS